MQGESNGDRARDFAKTRGQGKKQGLYKQHTPPASGRTKPHTNHGKAHAVPVPPEVKPGKGDRRDKAEQKTAAGSVAL